MIRNLIMLILATALFWLAAEVLLFNEQAPQDVEPMQPAQQGELEPIVPPPAAAAAPRVADVRVQTVDELELLLGRVEQLLERPRSEGEAPLISLVLHGPEVEFFTVGNYDKYKDVVDHAAKLAALGAVDIAVCQTQMKNLGIEKDQLPSFLRQVPYGPDEVERLIQQGFVYM